MKDFLIPDIVPLRRRTTTPGLAAGRTSGTRPAFSTPSYPAPSYPAPSYPAPPYQTQRPLATALPPLHHAAHQPAEPPSREHLFDLAATDYRTPAPTSPAQNAGSDHLSGLRQRHASLSGQRHVSLSGQRLSGSSLVRDPLTRPVSPPRLPGAAKPVIKVITESDLPEPNHRSTMRNVAEMPERSRLTPSQRLTQTRPSVSRDRNGKEAYVTYTVKPIQPR